MTDALTEQNLFNLRLIVGRDGCAAALAEIRANLSTFSEPSSLEAVRQSFLSRGMEPLLVDQTIRVLEFVAARERKRLSYH